MGIGDFFLNNPHGTGNDDGHAAGPIVAPAFSITKVLAAGSVVIGPVVAVVTKTIEGKDFDPTPGQVVAFVLGLLGTLAILGAADVIARAIASRSDAMAKVRSSADFQPFSPALRGRLMSDPAQPEVDIVAIAGGAMAHYLVVRPTGPAWVLADTVEILGAPWPAPAPVTAGNGSVPVAA